MSNTSGFHNEGLKEEPDISPRSREPSPLMDLDRPIKEEPESAPASREPSPVSWAALQHSFNQISQLATSTASSLSASNEMEQIPEIDPDRLTSLVQLAFQRQPASTSAYKKFGNRPRAQTLLAKEVGKYPEIYSLTVGQQRKLDYFHQKVPDTWFKVLRSMRTHFPDAQEESVFACWRYLRLKYLARKSNRSELPHLAYLERFVNLNSSSKFGHKLCAADKFVIIYGQDALELLFSESSKEKTFFKTSLSNIYKPDDLNNVQKNAWRKIIREVWKQFPTVCEEEALAAWLRVRKHYKNPVRTGKYYGTIAVLNELYGLPKASRTVETTQPHISETDNSLIPSPGPSGVGSVKIADEQVAMENEELIEPLQSAETPSPGLSDVAPVQIIDQQADMENEELLEQLQNSETPFEGPPSIASIEVLDRRAVMEAEEPLQNSNSERPSLASAAASSAVNKVAGSGSNVVQMPKISPRPHGKQSTGRKHAFNIRYGDNAVETLITVMGQFPELCKLWMNSKTQLKSVKDRADWKAAFLLMNTRMNKPINEEDVFTCWRKIRVSYETLRCPQLYRGKLPFLDQHIAAQQQPEPVVFPVSKNRGRGQVPETSLDIFARVYGEDDLQHILEEIGNSPLFYQFDFEREGVVEFKHLPLPVQGAWNEFILKVIKKRKVTKGRKHGLYDQTQYERKAFNAWKLLRSNYYAKVPGRYDEKLAFLNEEHQEKDYETHDQLLGAQPIAEQNILKFQSPYESAQSAQPSSETESQLNPETSDLATEEQPVEKEEVLVFQHSCEPAANMDQPGPSCQTGLQLIPDTTDMATKDQPIEEEEVLVFQHPCEQATNMDQPGPSCQTGFQLNSGAENLASDMQFIAHENVLDSRNPCEPTTFMDQPSPSCAAPLQLNRGVFNLASEVQPIADETEEFQNSSEPDAFMDQPGPSRHAYHTPADFWAAAANKCQAQSSNQAPCENCAARCKCEQVQQINQIFKYLEFLESVKNESEDDVNPLLDRCEAALLTMHERRLQRFK